MLVYFLNLDVIFEYNIHFYSKGILHMHTQALNELAENIVKHNDPMSKEDWYNFEKRCEKEARELVAQVSCYHKVVTLSGYRKVSEHYQEDVIRYQDWDVRTQQMNCEYVFGPKFQLSQKDAIEHIYNYLLMKYETAISWV